MLGKIHLEKRGVCPGVITKDQVERTDANVWAIMGRRGFGRGAGEFEGFWAFARWSLHGSFVIAR